MAWREDLPRKIQMQCVDSGSGSLIGWRCLSRLQKECLIEKSSAGGEGEMEISCLMVAWNRSERESRMGSRWKSLARRLGRVLLTVSLGGVAIAQRTPLVLEGDGRGI